MAGEHDAWRLLRELSRSASVGAPAKLRDVARPAGLSAAAEQLLDLYLPLCVGDRAGTLVVAHLGQSLDGRATPIGPARFITGPGDVKHTHRMRALFDAVLVGRATVEVDDPQLTLRLVSGEQPTRVLLDPAARLRKNRHVFTDGAARTLVVTSKENAATHPVAGADVGVVGVSCQRGALDLPEMLAALGARGIRRIFIEGGGTTVSRFLEAGLVDRLQIAVAPQILGTGRPAIDVSAKVRESLVRARRFVLAPDVLFDCDLRGGAG